MTATACLRPVSGSKSEADHTWDREPPSSMGSSSCRLSLSTCGRSCRTPRTAMGELGVVKGTRSSGAHEGSSQVCPGMM